MKRLTDHLIVISFDCLSSLDYSIIKELPHFQEYLDGASICTNVASIYPSVTYPCHATLVTGNFPNRHGVINNTLLQPGRVSPDWYWHRRRVRGTTLYDEAKTSGLTTAALLWPVTAKANIDYNMPEIFANRPWHHQVAVSLRNGSPLYQLDLNRRFGSLRKGLSQPELDDFVLESTVYTIQTKRPNLLLVHFTDLDTQRHYHGFSSEEAVAAIQRHDQRLGRILSALKESGLYERSTVVVLGDHSALDESKAIKPNVWLHEKGLIEVNRRGKITNWKAYCKSCDGSAYLYLKDQNDHKTRLRVKELLDALLADRANGIDNVITGEEVRAAGADGEASFMLEAKRGFYFSERYDGNYVDTITEQDVQTKRYTIASHGYSPDKAQYATIFMAKGQGIRPNQWIPSMRLVDEAPTFARLLGVHLGETDGRIVTNLVLD